MPLPKVKKCDEEGRSDNSCRGFSFVFKLPNFLPEIERGLAILIMFDLWHDFIRRQPASFANGRFGLGFQLDLSFKRHVIGARNLFKAKLKGPSEHDITNLGDCYHVYRV